MQNFTLSLLEPGKAVLSRVGLMAIDFLLVVILFVIGWLLSNVVRVIVGSFLKTIRLDALSKRIALDQLLAKGGITIGVSELAAGACYWIGILLTVIIAVNAAGMTIAADLLSKVVLFIPQVVSALLILIAGMFAAAILKNIVQTAAVNAGITQASLLVKIIEITVMVFVCAVALEQLHVGVRIIELSIAIILGSCGLACALAFGLGCKDIAAKKVAEYLDTLKKK